MLESSSYVDREQVDVTCHRCEIEDITEYPYSSTMAGLKSPDGKIVSN